MLSIEIPPGPSCPCKPSELRADDSTCETVGLGEAQATNFSIREYVFKSRGKDISVNWPFHQHLLQTCLKHGIRDVLPPFKPPDPVRISAKFESLAIKGVGPVDDETCNIEPNTCLQSDELVVGCSEKHKVRVDCGEISDNASSFEGIVETISAVTNQYLLGRDNSSELCCSKPVNISVSEESLEIEATALRPLPSKLETLRCPSEGKCRSLVKLSSCTEINRTEDIVSTSSTVSDPMASKVCPVCKLFASTSNTTLNAHIDQCLSIDYNMKRDDKKIEIPKVKPPKKRLMVDIYDTSYPSTLEDLDRRNGTNWAVELALTAQTCEPCSTEFKKPKLSPAVTKDDEKTVEASEYGNEGAVYVDSNGIKLRILSKFRDIPPEMPKEHFKLKKHAKKMKGDKSLSISKKRCFRSKYSKCMKVKSQTKKVSLFKSFNGKIQGAPGEDVNSDMEKEEPPSEILNTPDQIKSSGTTTLRHWVCSKRSDLPKKLNHKDINNTEKSKLVCTKLFVERNQPELHNSLDETSPILQFSKPSDELTCAQKTKRVEFLSNSVQITGSGKNPKQPVFYPQWSSKSTSTNGLMLKISRSLGTLDSSQGRREEIHLSTAEKSDNSHDTDIHSLENHQHSMKTTSMKKNAFLGRSSFLEENNADVGDKLSTFRKFRKRRSVLTTGKQSGSPSDINRGVCRSIKHYGYNAVRTNITIRIPQSDLSKGFYKVSTEEIMDKESPSSNNISESEDGEGASASAMENQKYNTLKWVHPDVECHDSELVPSGMQDELLSRRDIMTKSSIGEAVAVDDHVDSEHLAPAASSKLDPGPSLEENVHSGCGNGSHSEPSSGKLCDEQAVQYYKAAHEEVVSQSIQLSNEGIRGEGYSSAAQYRDGPAGAASVQESSACLTSYEDTMLENPQENSSITSIIRVSDPDPTVATNREPSGSSVSTASNISPSLKDSVADPLMKPTVQDKSGLVIRCAANLVGTERTVERRNREANASPHAKEPEKISDHPCCCVRNDGLYGQSPFSRQSSLLAGRILPCRGKQVSNLYITASTSPSLNSYPNSRTDVMVSPVLESPTESVTTKASADSAMKGLTCTDFSSPSPSPRTQAQLTSNSILRLMGKNLMVPNKEEAMQQPMTYTVPNTPSNIQCLPSSVSSTSSWECFSYHHHRQVPSTFRHQMPLPPSNMQVGCFAGSLSAGPMVNHDQYNSNRKHNPLSESNMERPAASHQHPREFMCSSQASMMNEVIVIDDSPDFVVPKYSRPYPISIPPPLPVSNLMQQRPFSCFPTTESHFFPVNGTSGLRLYPNVCPRDYTNRMMQGNISEGPDCLLLPKQMAYQPPTGYLNSPFFYSQMSQH